MKKIINKFIKILLLIIITLSNFIMPTRISSLTQSEVKEETSKGEIYNPQTDSLGSSATINAHNYANNETYERGDVEVKKIVSKVNNSGLYNVEFFVRGKEEVVTQTKDTYIVFVIDRSYTMRLNNRWEEAKQAVIDISTELSKVNGIKMALVGFSGGKASSQEQYDDTVTLRGKFSSSAFTNSEIGNYDTDNQLGGGTNIQAGLLKANELLSGKIGTKYVVLLSDGVPTLYYDNNGYSKGTGNSNTAEKISGVPECRDKAISASNILKDNKVSVYTIGYYLNELTNIFNYKGVTYNEKNLAIQTLQGVATSNSYYFQSDSNSTNTLIKILKEIKTDITTFKAGYNPKIIDNIGSNFRLNVSSNYGGDKTLTTDSTFEITENWKSIGSFNINIDTTLQKGWYQTNNDFTLTYEKNTGEVKTINCIDDPEVYWEQEKHEYKVNYYFNNKLDSTLTKKEIAYFNTFMYAKDNYLDNELLINKNIKDKTTYFLDPTNNSNTSNIKINSDVNKNVLNIYYIDTKFTSESIDKNSNLEIINNSSTIVPYTIEYKVDINNVRSGDKLITIITDILPHEIDVDNKNTNLNGGIYSKENKTITWYFEEEINTFKEKYNINKKIEYSLVYKNFADISSKENNNLINNVNGFTKVNDKQTDGVKNGEDIQVIIPGNVIVNYITKDNVKLCDSVIINGLVGTSYETIKKEFDKYSFIEVVGDVKGIINEGTMEVTYIYDLTPLPPHTGINNSINYVKYILLFTLILVLIILLKKFYLKTDRK